MTNWFNGVERQHQIGSLTFKSYMLKKQSGKYRVRIFEVTKRSGTQYCFKFKWLREPTLHDIEKRIHAYYMKERQLEFKSFVTNAILGLSTSCNLPTGWVIMGVKEPTNG